MTTRTSKDPLRATVVALPCKMTLPTSDSRPCQRWPLMFVSTSNSTSMAPFSSLALSFRSLAPLHGPSRTSWFLSVGWAIGGPPSN